MLLKFAHIRDNSSNSSNSGNSGNSSNIWEYMQYWDDSVDFFPSLFSLRQLLGTFLQSSHTHTCKLFTRSMINLRYPHSSTNKKDMVKWGLPVDSARWIGLGTTFQTLLIVDFVAFVKVKTVGAWEIFLAGGIWNVFAYNARTSSLMDKRRPQLDSACLKGA